MESKKNGENTSKRPETRIPEVISNPAVRKYIRSYYNEQGKPHYPDIAMSRWKNGTHHPPVEVLIGIAKVLGTNLSYILGLTDVNAFCNYDIAPKNRTLSDLMDARKMNLRDLALSLNNNYRALHNFQKELPRKRVYSLIALSDAVNMSADYILGYTDWETWEMYASMIKPFKNMKAGSAAYIVADKSCRSASDIEAAIKRGDGQYCLLTTDGKFVLFPNGNRISIYDDMFRGAFIVNVKPEIT